MCVVCIELRCSFYIVPTLPTHHTRMHSYRVDWVMTENAPIVETTKAGLIKQVRALP